jgi:hypothetical protein
MRRWIALWASLLMPVISGCDRKQSVASGNQVSPALPYRTATAAEVFDLRSRCETLGQKILEADIHGPALDVQMTSHYNPPSNRCFVELDATQIAGPTHIHHETLYDGQTNDILAFTEIDDGGKKKAAVFAKDDDPADEHTDFYQRASA